LNFVGTHTRNFHECLALCLSLKTAWKISQKLLVFVWLLDSVEMMSIANTSNKKQERIFCRVLQR